MRRVDKTPFVNLLMWWWHGFGSGVFRCTQYLGMLKWIIKPWSWLVWRNKPQKLTHLIDGVVINCLPNAIFNKIVRRLENILTQTRECTRIFSPFGRISVRRARSQPLELKTECPSSILIDIRVAVASLVSVQVRPQYSDITLCRCRVLIFVAMFLHIARQVWTVFKKKKS